MQLKQVSAKTGYVWFRQGIGIFRRNPLVFITLFFAYMFLLRLVSLPPVIGSVILLFVVPGLSVGFLAASRAVLAGKPAFPTILISGFRAHGPLVAKRLLLLGVPYGIAFVSVFAISALADGGVFAQMIVMGTVPSENAARDAGLTGAFALASLAYIPVAMLFWFSPVLIAWHEVPLAKALFFSWMACWRNRGAFTVYALLWFALMMGASMLMVLLWQLMGAGGVSLLVLAMPMSGIFWSVVFCSFYATYRGCFDVDGPELPVIGAKAIKT